MIEGRVVEADRSRTQTESANRAGGRSEQTVYFAERTKAEGRSFEGGDRFRKSE
jgi:hypothetical protein